MVPADTLLQAQNRIMIVGGRKSSHKPMSTPAPSLCKDFSHELVPARRTPPWLSPWESERGFDPGGARIDRPKGTRRLYLRRSCPLGGVSPAAPYRHFRDRDELLADVARRGFDQFEVVLARAWDGGRPDAFTAFDRLGKAYLQFAKSEPAYDSAMFEAGIPPEASPELRDAGERAFAVLRTAAERLIATMPAQHRPPVLMMTLHIWAMSHKIASLLGEATPRAGRSQCCPRIYWRQRCSSICAVWV